MNNYCETKESCRDKMIRRVKGLIPQIIGTLIGGIAGYLYYSNYSCSGSCAITSNPWLTIIWGAVIGYLIGDSLKKKNNKISKQ